MLEERSQLKKDVQDSEILEEVESLVAAYQLTVDPQDKDD